MHAAWKYIKSPTEKAVLVIVSRKTDLAADTTMDLLPLAVTHAVITYSLHWLI